MNGKISRNLLFNILIFAILLLARGNANSFWDAIQTGQHDVIRNHTDIVFQILLCLNVAFFLKELVNFFYLKKYAAGGEAPPKLIKDLLIILIFFADVFYIFSIVLHQPLTGIWITSGTLTLVLGFALRTIILDLFSGIAVNIEKPYQIGDWIEIHQRFAVNSMIGQITNISWRATHICTDENTNVVIPNSLMTTMVVTTNYWHRSKATRFQVMVTLDFSIPAVRVKRILMAGTLEAMKENGFVKENPPQVLIENTDDRGVVYKVRYWITPWHPISPSAAKDKVFSSIFKHLDAAGLSLANPKEDVYHYNMPPRQLDPDKILDRSKLLSQIEIFTILTPEETEQLSKKIFRHTYSTGQCVVNQGEKGSSMFVIFEGLLEVMVSDGETIVTVATLAPSDYFGEMSLLTGESRSATIRCLSDSVVYEIKQNEFTELIYKRDEIVEQIAFKIEERRLSNLQLIQEEKDHLKMKPSHEFRITTLINKIRQFFIIPSSDAVPKGSPNHGLKKVIS